MAEKNYIQAIQGLLQELKQITIMAMAETGVEKSSDLAKSVKYILTKEGVKMEVNNYYEVVSAGRRGTKRKRGLRRVPLNVLIEWIKQNGIVPRNKKTGRFMTINQLAFAIQNKIYLYGINSKKPVKGKGYADIVENKVADYTAEELADVLAELIAENLVDSLTV